MNLPNRLTVLRMWMALGMTLCLSIPFPFSRTLAVLIFVAASITDFFDGYIARKMNAVTTFGKFMDPLADKLLVAAALIFLASPLMDAILAPWMVIVIIGREFTVSGLRMVVAKEGVALAAGSWGKHKTVWQMIMIILVFGWMSAKYDFIAQFMDADAGATLIAGLDPVMHAVTFYMGLAVTGITVLSGLVYLRDCRDIITRDM